MLQYLLLIRNKGFVFIISKVRQFQNKKVKTKDKE